MAKETALRLILGIAMVALLLTGLIYFFGVAKGIMLYMVIAASIFYYDYQKP